MRGAGLSVLRATDPAGRRVPSRSLGDRARASVLRILGGNVLCALATVSPGGRPHVSTAYFCFSRALELFFLSHPSSRHCRNLSVRPAAAIAVFASSQRWGGRDRGVQLFGTCRVATGLAVRDAERLYRERFPRYARWRSRLDADAPASEYRLYRFVMRTLTVLDEETLGDGLLVHAALVRPRPTGG
jgi:uncharacterized protein YhbP (UPF0306 family)